MKKISMVLIVTVLMTMCLPFMAAAEEVGLTLLTDLDDSETLIYGTTNQTGAVVDRIDSLEKAVYGGVFPLSVPERIAQIKNLLTVDKQDAPSLFSQLKADEWVAQKKISYAAFLPRLEILEKTLLGTNQTQNSLVQRMQTVNTLCFKDGVIPMTALTIEPQTLVVVEFMTDLNSKANKEGDAVEFQVAEDVVVNNVLLIPAGSKAFGVVTKAKSAKAFGQNGKLELDFKTVDGFDDTKISLILGEKAKEENKNVAFAAGASFAGAVLLGPIGLVGGAFVKGKQAQIPAGSKTYLEVQEAVPMMGLTLGVTNQ